MNGQQNVKLDLVAFQDSAGDALDRLTFVTQTLCDCQGGVIYYDGKAASGLVQILGDAVADLQKALDTVAEGKQPTTDGERGELPDGVEARELMDVVMERWGMVPLSCARLNDVAEACKAAGVSMDDFANSGLTLARRAPYDSFWDGALVAEEDEGRVCELLDEIAGLCYA